MKISFVQAPAWGRDCPPYTMCLLAAVVRKQGHQAYLFDLNNSLYHTSSNSLKKFWDDKDYYAFWEEKDQVVSILSSNNKALDFFVRRILDTGSPVIGFTVHFSSCWASLEIAKRIKQADKKRIVVFGGPDCSRRQKGSFFAGQDCVDIVVCGEGEEAIFDIIENAGRLDEAIKLKGCLFKRDGRIVDGGDLPGTPDLDSLPFADYSDFKDEIESRAYREPHRLDIFDSRSCPTRCHFCSEWQFWGKFRCRSGESIYREVTQRLKEFPGVNYFYFIGSLLNGDIRSLDKFCDLTISGGLDIRWAGQAIIRPEMNRDFLAKMRRAGCAWLGYGIESGSQNVLGRMNKRFSLEVASQVLRDTKRSGISTQANFMFGLPAETEEDFKQTLGFLRENYRHMDTILASQSFCVIDKGTYLYEHPEEFGIRNRHHHLYWDSNNGENNYVTRQRRYEEFCRLALSLGIPETSGVLRFKPDKWRLLGDYFNHKRQYKEALENYTRAWDAGSRTGTLAAKLSACYEEACDYDKAIRVLDEASARVSNTGGEGNALMEDSRRIKRLKQFIDEAPGVNNTNYSLVQSRHLHGILRHFAHTGYKGIDPDKLITDFNFNEKQKSMSRALYSHGLWEKLSNYILAEIQKARREAHLFGYPYWLVIDPCNFCNLSCPFCPTGQRRNVRTKGKLNFRDFKEIMDKLGPYLIHVDLVNWGEPFLNEDIFDMIKYAKQFRCDIKVDTNFNFFSEAKAKKLVLSGLDKIVVSIDGLTKETYGKYRKGGNFELAMNNLKILLDARRQLKRSSPYITWQFLVFRHNEHEVEEVKKTGLRLGIDHVGITKAFIGDKDWIPLNPEYSNYHKEGIGAQDMTFDYFKKEDVQFCNWPWEGIAINTNASVSACCSVEDENDDFGNFFDQPFEELWNSREYQLARSHISGKTGGPKDKNVCAACRHSGLINVDILSCHSFFDALTKK